MLRSLIQTSLRMRALVLGAAVLLLAIGAYDAQHARLDVFPDFAPPQVTVQAEAPGLSAQQVEELVTRPLEAALVGAAGLDSLRSQSIQGLSILTANFADGVDPFRARQSLSEQLSAAAATLPAGVETPRMTPLTSATMDVLKIGIASEQLSPTELRDFAQWTLRPRLLSVPGVAGASLFGGERRQLQIRLKPERLAAVDLSIQDVVDAARGATGVRGAGFVEGANQRVVVQTEGRSTTAAQLAGTVVARRDGRSVLLSELADVVDGAEPKFGDTLIQGKPGVLLTMLSQYGANTMDVTRGLESALDEMRPALERAGITLYPRLHRPASFVENAIGNLRESLLIGAVLVVLVLLLFLHDLRSALISLTAIPLSLAAAVIVMHRFGVTLNTITLGGLVIALGEVVDDAIIDVENVVRRLREKRELGLQKSDFAVVLDASLEVRGAVVYATLVVGLVFLPVLTLSGLQGRMFAPLGQAYLLAVGASLVVALTVTPAMCLALLPGRARELRELKLLSVSRSAYRGVLERIARRPRSVIAISSLLCLGAAALLPFFGGEFLPDFREGHFVLQASAVPGTSLPEMKRLGARISADLLAGPHIATVEQQIGRAELGEDPWGPNRSEFHLELAPCTPEEEVEAEEHIRATLASYPGLETEVQTFLGDRIGETLSGETAAVVVNVFGEDLDELDRQAARIESLLQSVPGAVDVRRASRGGLPTLSVQLRPDRLAQFGLRPLEVLDAVETAFQGAKVAESVDGERVTNVVVVLDPERRREPEDIGRLLLRTNEGGLVPLAELAWISLDSARALIQHEGGRRRQTVTCNVSGRDLQSFTAEAQAKVGAGLTLPPGSYVAFAGEGQAAEAARRELLLYSALVLVAILALLGTVLGNPRNLLLVMANLPFALVGGVLAAWIQSHTLSLGSLVGFATLFGISTRNSIMLISHFEHLVREEGCPWNLATALRGASERFAPILMTALVTGLGLLPLAYSSGAAGREIEGPMAAVILGGLCTSTVLNLLVMPTLALRFGRFGRAHAE
ncbi:MAG: efflux RND transporter permease subunit [Planctomycetota bacterium]|nr:efflux RND transporter permease subunit [Planctomycetota bacterium]